MILRSGVYRLQRDSDPNKPCIIDYVCASAAAPSSISISLNGELVEDLYLGPYSPHTWWPNNSILGLHDMQPGDVLQIEVGVTAIVRIETNLKRI